MISQMQPFSKKSSLAEVNFQNAANALETQNSTIEGHLISK